MIFKAWSSHSQKYVFFYFTQNPNILAGMHL